MSNETEIGLIWTLTTTASSIPPRHSLSDYFVLILLSVCIAVGAPMTIMICWRLMQRLRLTGACRCNRVIGQHGSRRSSGRNRNAPVQTQTSTTSNLTPSRRTDLLKLQLNVADLMVLIFYAFSKVVWTLTYNWRGGVVLCKLVRFLSVLSFHMCSNSVVCVGLDRMITLIKPASVGTNRYSRTCAREYVMVAVSCILSFFCSLPQFWLWTVRELNPNWRQCMTVTTLGMSDGELALMEGYNVFHLLSIFWIPCTIIAVSYIVIVMQVLLHLKEPTAAGAYDNRLENTGRQSRLNGNVRAIDIRQWKFGKGLLQCGRLTRFLCRQTLTILTVYIICWGPYQTLTLWIYFNPQHTVIYRTMIGFLKELIVVNSVINPFLYACDVYHQIVDERTRHDPHSCLCCFFACPCALVEDSEGESIEDL